MAFALAPICAYVVHVTNSVPDGHEHELAEKMEHSGRFSAGGVEIGDNARLARMSCC